MVKSPADGASHVILIVQKGDKVEAHKADWVANVVKLKRYLRHPDQCPVYWHSARLMSKDASRPTCTCGLDVLLREIPGLLEPDYVII